MLRKIQKMVCRQETLTWDGPSSKTSALVVWRHHRSLLTAAPLPYRRVVTTIDWSILAVPDRMGKR